MCEKAKEGMRSRCSLGEFPEIALLALSTMLEKDGASLLYVAELVLHLLLQGHEVLILEVPLEKLAQLLCCHLQVLKNICVKWRS